MELLVPRTHKSLPNKGMAELFAIAM